MSSLSQFSTFAAPTPPPPFRTYTPLSRIGSTGLSSTRQATHLTAFGGALQRILSAPTAGIHGLKWLSRDGLSRRRQSNLPATATIKPTTTLVASCESSPATIALPPLMLLLSLLLGASLIYFHCRKRPPRTVLGVQKHKTRLKGHSLCSDSSRTVRLPCIFRVLRFALWSLAFVFRLIHLEKLLNMVEDNLAEQKATNTTPSYIVELRTLDRKLVRAFGAVQPTAYHADPRDVKTSPSICGRTSVHKTAGATSATLCEAGKSTSTNLRSKQTGIATPLSVEPSGAPENAIPLTSPGSPQRIRVTTDDSPSTPPHNHVSMPSVEPSGVPDGGAGRAGSIYQAELRRIFQRCLEDSPPQPSRHSAPQGTNHQAKTRRIPQPNFTGSRLQPDTLTTAGRPLDPPTRKLVSSNDTKENQKDDSILSAPLEDVRERARKTIERFREAAMMIETRVRAKCPAKGSAEQSRQSRQRKPVESVCSHSGPEPGSTNTPPSGSAEGDESIPESTGWSAGYVPDETEEHDVFLSSPFDPRDGFKTSTPRTDE